MMWKKQLISGFWVAFAFAAICGATATICSVKYAHGDEPTPRQRVLEDLLQTTQQLMQMDGRPEFVEMTTEQMKEDGCANPDNCPTLVSVHPPSTGRIIVNSDMDLQDINAQGQIVHVIAMYLVEQVGGYSPDMPCDRVMQLEAHAQVVQAAFMDLRLQEFIRTGHPVPEFQKLKVVTFCTPPAERGEF